MADDDPKRIEELEKRIKALEGLVGDLSRSLPSPTAADAARSADAVRRLWSQQAAAPQPPAVVRTPPVSEPVRETPREPYRPPKRDWEALIGRYGTLALATVSGLTAVGTFIGWAISQGFLGPAQRVGLGLVTAAGLAVAGLRMRRKERSFGSTLLGLSLAVVHVCAWGAGPSLNLVPPSVAFGLASLASAAIALLARIEKDEPLWCIGFIGAALAPFVTSTGSGNMPMLAAYGLAVLTASGRAIGTLTWTVAGRLFALASTLYVSTLMLGTEANHGPLFALGLPILVAAVGVMPWMRGVLRRNHLRPLGVLAAVAAVRAAYSPMMSDVPMEWFRHAMAIAGAGIAWLGMVDLSAVVPAPEPDAKPIAERDWLDAAIVPVTFSLAVIAALPDNPRMYALSLAASAVVFLATVARHRFGSLRDAAVAATAFATVGAATQFLTGQPLYISGAIAAFGAVCFAANLWRKSRSWEGIGSLALGWSMLAAVGMLSEREAYVYAPFATPESALAAVVFGAIFTAWRIVGEEQPPKLLKGGLVVWAFAWIHQELAFAFNPTAATLLRVSYYALTSVAAVWIGKAKSVPILRHLGLGLAVAAAGTALYSASGLANIGARIAADLVAAGFLLAIAFWYRKPGPAAQIEAPTPQEAKS
jgi:hypothetical protein